MKKLIFALAAMAIAATAQARSLAPNVMSSDLKTIELDEKLSFSNYGLSEGHISIKHDTQQVALVLTNNTCEGSEGSCPDVIDPKVVIELPLVNENASFCGTYYYVAEEDMRPVDGMLEQILVSDHTGNFCETDLPAIEVYYMTKSWDRINHVEVETFSAFTAGPWQRVLGVVTRRND